MDGARPFAAMAVVMAVLLTGCRAAPEAVPDVATGVPRTLAAERGGRVSGLHYDLAFDIPADPGAPIEGRVTLSFDLAGADRALALDFAPATQPGETDAAGSIHSVSAGGGAVDYRTANGHILIPPTALNEGRNTFEIAFRAGDAALNRNDAFLYSLFVPALAHTVFPCFDQPDLKARFRLSLTIPRQWRALSNGGETARESVDGGVRIHYAETPPIPTYLLAFAAGHFQVEEAVRDGRRMRLFHRETDAGRLERNRRAVFDLHDRSLDWMADYTGIDYPFGKFDFILIPDFQFGGMEHPGAIYYRASRVLLDEAASQRQHLDRAGLIAHETSHMWFGDLVTMRWFDDVWMKEVFANFMAGKIVNPSFSDVNHDLLFLTDNYPAAYGVDRTAGTHPIRQALDNLSEAGSLYGPIIYQKAPIVMRQLERIVGEDVFREGMRRYLRLYRFGNASWPDLIDVLDPLSDRDLLAWSRAWVEEAGRASIRTELETDEEGRITRLVLLQSDPVPGRFLRWPQEISVLIGTAGGPERLSVALQGRRTPVPGAVGLRPDFILPSGGGLAYGDIELDEASREALLRTLPALGDPLERGAAWITLWESMLAGRVAPGSMMDLALSTLAEEDSEQVVQLILDGTRALFWRYLTPAARVARAAQVEAVLAGGMTEGTSASLQAAYFSAYIAVATTDRGIGLMERLWRREITIAGLPLSERDETALAEQLALRAHPRAGAILAEQRARIDNPDRRERLEFLLPALSANPGDRAEFFDRILSPAGRTRESWVVDAMGFLHHPLRAEASLAQILPALEALEEIRATGDIFFPRNWSGSLLSGHASPAARDIVRGFLEERGPDYPVRLRQIILQAADPLFRAAEIRGNQEG